MNKDSHVIKALEGVLHDTKSIKKDLGEIKQSLGEIKLGYQESNIVLDRIELKLKR